MRFASAPARPMPLHFDFALTHYQSGVKQMTFKRPNQRGMGSPRNRSALRRRLRRRRARAECGARRDAAAAAATRPQQGRYRLDAGIQRARSDDVDSRPRPVLRRSRPHQEHGLDPDPGVRDRLHGRRGLDALRLLAGLQRRRQHDALDRRLHQGLPAWRRRQLDGGNLLQRRRDSGTRLLRASR